ncbi:MAG: NAD-dependent epimerase/dehydratase family protein [Nocardioidaceae bacterium]
MVDLSRVAVTGGAGFLGVRLCEVLLEGGSEVICLDNFATSTLASVEHLATSPGFHLRPVDVSEPFDVEGPLDAVCHLASPASPIDYLRLPIETLRVGSLGTMHALDLAQRMRARFVLASTSEVYGDPLQHPQREDYWGNVNPVGPRGVYDEAKRFGEAVTTAYRSARDVNTGIVRIFNSYGPRMRGYDGRAVPTFIRQALSGEPITVAGDGSQTRSLCYVDDTVRGLITMANSEHSGPINIGNADEVSVLQLAMQIKELTVSDSPVRHVELPEDDPKVRRPDISLAAEVLGWSPSVTTEVGLQRTVEWFAAAVATEADSTDSAQAVTSSA